MWAEPSAHKQFLLGVGIAAVLCMSLCVFLSASLMRGLPMSLPLEAAIVTLFLGAMLACAPVIALLAEYTRLVRTGQSWWKRFSGLSWQEIKDLTAACPPLIKFAALGIGGLGFFQCLRMGHFAVGDPGIAAPDLIGILAGATFFLALCIPFLLAAAFERGSYAQRLRRRATDPVTRAR